MSGATNAPPTSVIVKDPTGNSVAPQIADRFGNFWSSDSNGNLIDDLGRTPVITTTSGNTTYYDVLAPNGPISNSGTRVRYTVTTAQVKLNTAFGQSGVTEYQDNNGQPATITAISSIQLPDGSSYQFLYDSYGAISQMTLPTGGVVKYGWENYQDSYQNVQHWLSSSTVDNYTTKYTPSVVTQCSAGSCQEQVNVQRPSGDETVYTLTLINGSWNTNTTVYSGSAAGNNPKLQNTTAYDFSRTCAFSLCIGAQYITKATETHNLPDAGLSSQTQFTYSKPATGQVTGVSQWDYYTTGSSPSSIPTRSATYGYTGYDLTSESHFDASGNLASAATYTYTQTATATSGIAGHATYNAGGPYMTTATVQNNLGSPSVSMLYGYEDTGNLVSSRDANGYSTQYKYDPTHTFTTEIDKPSTTTNGTTFQHVTKATYDGNSGAIQSTDDENSVANGQAYTIRYSYEPKGGRLQAINAPLGAVQTFTYPNANEIDLSVAQKAGVNQTTATILDGYGRTSETLSGGVSTTVTYDVNGRTYGVTNPAGGSSTTDGTMYTTYDTLNRVTGIQNPDGTSRSEKVVGNAYTSTDELGNQKKQVLNAFGQIASVFEADPASGALTLETDYKYDGLGNMVCLEQHGSVVVSSGCSSAASSDTGSSWRVRRFLYNYLSQLRAASVPEHTSANTSPASAATQNCSLAGGAVWTDCYSYDSNGNLKSSVDNRGVTRTYTYDALNRPLLQTSPYGPTQDLWYDAGANGVGHLYHASNDYNAASTYSYDALGRVVTEAQCRPSNCFGTGYVSVSSTYDLAGNPLSITYPDGRTVGIAYDALNRPTSVDYQRWNSTSTGSNYWSANSYAAPGLLQSATYGDSVQMQAKYNNRLVLTQLSYGFPATSTAPQLNIHGYRDSSNASCGIEGSLSGVPSGVAGMVIKAGDQLMYTMRQTLPTYGGLALIFTNGTGSGDATDASTGQALYANSITDGQFHTLVGSLTPSHTGATISYVLAGVHQNMPSGVFDMYITSAYIQHADGTTTSIYSGQPASVPSFTGNTCGGQQLSSGTLTLSPVGAKTFFSKGYIWDKNASNLTIESNQLTSQQRQFGYDHMNRLTSAVDVSASSTHATGLATVSGQDQTTQVCTGDGDANADSSSGSSPQATLPPPKCNPVWDSGYLYLTVGGFTVSTVYVKSSTSATLAASLATLLNSDNSPVTATSSGSTIAITSIAAGTTGNYALSWGTDKDFTIGFSNPTMTGGSSGTITGGTNQQYTLDAWGNLSSMGSSGFSQFINTHNQVGGFGYDAAGRLLNDGITSYSYDDDGMLLNSSDGSSYVYDAENHRAQVASGGASKEYYYFGGQLMAVLNPATGAWTDMIYAGRQRIATVPGTQTATPVYIFPDHEDTQAASVNASGSASSLDYTPFGQLISGSTSTDNYIFTGLERDATGLDHAGFRQYSSNSARWTTPDPSDGSYNPAYPQSLNRYAYVGNMPLSLTDVSGLDADGGGGGWSSALPCSSAVESGGLNIPGDILCGVQVGELINDLVGLFGHSKFHGSLTPRPQTRIWDEHLPGGPNYGAMRSGLPSIGQVLSLPAGGCEFGACSVGDSFQAGAATAPATWCTAHPTICTVGEDAGTFLEDIPVVLASAMLLNMKGDNAPSSAKCEEIKQVAIQSCSARFIGRNDHESPVKTRACVRQILNDAGCFNY